MCVCGFVCSFAPSGAVAGAVAVARGRGGRRCCRFGLREDIARRHRRVSSNRICAPGRRAFFEGSRRTRAEDEEEDDDDGCFSRGRPLVVRVGRFVRKAVTSSFFDYMVCLALVVNSVLIGVEACSDRGSERQGVKHLAGKVRQERRRATTSA